jgi:serine/threonine-protein kinase
MKSNQSITLAVSSGAVQVAVPNVAGQPSAQAAQTLQSAGFVVNQTAANSSTVAQGDVISTSPAGGSKAAQGSAINMVVSSGKQTVTIPSLVGQSPVAAGQQLGALQLLTTTADESSSSVPSGQVTRTNPPAGTSVAVGSSVTVYVSTGPAQVQVPDLSGDTQNQAQAALQSVGLQLGNVTFEPVSSHKQDGEVQSQDPTAGSQAAQGSSVDVVIGQYSSSATTTPTTTSPGGGGGGGGGTGNEGNTTTTI